MHWESFFQDLEDQLAAEWEAERAALDSEAERLRVSRLTLRERLSGLGALAEDVRLELSDGSAHDARIDSVGADWVGARTADGSLLIVRADRISAIGLQGRAVVESARAGAAPADRLGERITFGFALRDLARRRVPVMVGTASGRLVTGTFDRVASDHADLAVHDGDAPRRAGEVRAFRIVPLTELVWVRPGADSDRVG
ncbi:hypothetical protein [Microbacterium halophytorum]|uniref:hypothetical protein n=1 Tax=Microbacterium halophytorum TaxID=2067568 RepID=UPI000CFD9495|nr:hypothetical protein [Microbacterium halophytorum]